MKDAATLSAEPTETLMQAWIYQASWTTRDALLLALGISPDAADAVEHIAPLSALLERTTSDGIRSAAPIDWLWWGEKNGVPFHSDWWLAITPQGPIGFDGQHFALLREEMLSDAYLQRERHLITKWARKPYWTPREAIDLSLNFDPFTTDSWRGQEPEFGNTIRERDDRFRMLERTVEVGDISEKAAPKDYVLWLDKCGYIISEAWRRAVGLERRVFGAMEQDQLSSLQEENARLRRDLEERAAQAAAQGDVQRRLAALGDENENLQRQIEALAVASADDKNEEANQIQNLQRRIKQLSEDFANPSEKSALTRKVICLEKILIGAVCDAYNFDLRATRSDTAKQIAAKTVELNCDVAESTILNYIRESANTHVDPDVWGQMYPRK